MVKYVIATVKEIARFMSETTKYLREEELARFVEVLAEAYENNRKVLIVGAGRSGLIGRAFAMRLMHLGLNVYVLGETITPRLDPEDLVVVISGSGRTHLVVTAAEAAKALGAKVVTVTSHPESPLGKLADLVVYVPGRTKIAEVDEYVIRQIMGLHEPLTPLGTLFENTALAVLDGVIVELMKKLGKSEKELAHRHANIE